MFRDVPECSGMFHVPGFIDGHVFLLLSVGFARGFAAETNALASQLPSNHSSGVTSIQSITISHFRELKQK